MDGRVCAESENALEKLDDERLTSLRRHRFAGKALGKVDSFRRALAGTRKKTREARLQGRSSRGARDPAVDPTTGRCRCSRSARTPASGLRTRQVRTRDR